MYTTHSSPNRAQTVAVATPCWPAPVSAMMRRFPIRSASSACPIVLLILCAPVWLRSSRLSTTIVPASAPSRGASVSGEGRPTNSASSASYSAQKARSPRTPSYNAARSSSAATSVSGTYRPP